MKSSIIRRVSLGLVASAALFLFATSPAGAANEYKLLVSWSPGIPTVDAYLKKAMEYVEANGGGDISFKRMGPEVVPPFEQLEPVSSGSFDMLYTHPAYHAGATGIGMMMDAVTNDSDKRRETGIWDWVDRYYQEEFDVKLISMPSGSHFQILLREPLSEAGDLKGRKIRSNPAYDALIEDFGGIPTTLPVPQIFPALQKGLVDGTAFPLHSMIRLKFNEVVKYMARPTFGHSTNLWLVHLETWNKMDKKTQKVLLDAGKAVEESAVWLSKKIQLEDEQAMIKEGAEYTYFDAEKAAKIEELFNQGIFKRGISVSGDKAREFVNLVKEKDMVQP